MLCLSPAKHVLCDSKAPTVPDDESVAVFLLPPPSISGRRHIANEPRRGAAIHTPFHDDLPTAPATLPLAPLDISHHERVVGQNSYPLHPLSYPPPNDPMTVLLALPPSLPPGQPGLSQSQAPWHPVACTLFPHPHKSGPLGIAATEQQPV